MYFTLERTIARQRSRIRWLHEGDANSRLFHVVANGRHVKNYISATKRGEELITDQNRKVETFTEAYTKLLGKIYNRDHGINLNELQLPNLDLSSLEEIFLEEEVWG
jgi:hypothetical protein